MYAVCRGKFSLCFTLCERFGTAEKSRSGPQFYWPSQDRGPVREALQSLWNSIAFPRMGWIILSWPFRVVLLMEIAVQTQGTTELGSSTMAGRHLNLSSCWVLILFFTTWSQCNRHERFVVRIRKERFVWLWWGKGPALRESRKLVQCVMVGKKQREDKVGEIKIEMDHCPGGRQ